QALRPELNSVPRDSLNLVGWRPIGIDVGDVTIRSPDAQRLPPAFEQGSGAANEWLSLLILSPPGSLTDANDLGVAVVVCRRRAAVATVVRYELWHTSPQWLGREGPIGEPF